MADDLRDLLRTFYRWRKNFGTFLTREAILYSTWPRMGSFAGKIAANMRLIAAALAAIGADHAALMSALHALLVAHIRLTISAATIIATQNPTNSIFHQSSVPPLG